MDTTTSSKANNTAAAADAGKQLEAALGSADTLANQGIQGLLRVHQARLSQANRTVAVLKTQFSADDPRVRTAEASVASTKTTISRVTILSQQMASPPVQVVGSGWALQGRVLDAQLRPAARFTVFLVDASREFLQQYGFAYTDDTGYFLLNYAGGAGQAAAATQLFIEVANTDANPVYLSAAPFQPVLGTASLQNIVLPAGGGPIGDPPPAIRAVALPGKGVNPKKATGANATKK